MTLYIYNGCTNAYLVETFTGTWSDWTKLPLGQCEAIQHRTLSQICFANEPGTNWNDIRTWTIITNTTVITNDATAKKLVIAERFSRSDATERSVVWVETPDKQIQTNTIQQVVRAGIVWGLSLAIFVACVGLLRMARFRGWSRD